MLLNGVVVMYRGGVDAADKVESAFPSAFNLSLG